VTTYTCRASFANATEEDLAVGLAVLAVEQDLVVELVEVAVGTAIGMAIGMEEGLVEEWVALQRLVT